MKQVCTEIESLFALWNVLQSPADCFVNAAKMGIVDDLQGSLDALSWGNTPSLGTGGQFDILYSGKVDLVLFFLLDGFLNVRKPVIQPNIWIVNRVVVA